MILYNRRTTYWDVQKMVGRIYKEDRQIEELINRYAQRQINRYRQIDRQKDRQIDIQ